jgi:hypothetical protein
MESIALIENGRAVASEMARCYVNNPYRDCMELRIIPRCLREFMKYADGNGER